MAVTVTTKQSWGSRLGNSFKGIVVGLVLFVIAFPVLFMNEGRTVKRAKALEAGESAVVPVLCDTVDAANEGKLVHTSGKLATIDTLEDWQFGLKVKGIRLKRKVEMYQWVEESESRTEEKLGGGTETVTTYTYKKEWCNKRIDSSEFQEKGHDNPVSIPFEAKQFQAKNVTLGAYVLSDDIIGRIGGDAVYALPQDFVVPENLSAGATYEAGQVYGNAVYFMKRGISAEVQNIAQVAGENVAQAVEDAVVEKPKAGRIAGQVEAEIGDVRVTFAASLPHDFSIVAQQQGNGFVAYATKDGTVLLTADRMASAVEMFQSAKSANKVMAWVLRFLGWLLMFIGVKTILEPLRILAAVVPFIGRIVGFGAGLVALAVSLPLTLITIAIAWIYYRPILGISLIVLAVGIFAFILYKKKGTSAPAPAGE